MKSSKSITDSKASHSTKSFMLYTLNKSRDTSIQKSEGPSENKIIKKPYIMIQPKLIEELDDQNTKRTKLLFENRIAELKTTEIVKSEQQLPITQSPINSVRQRRKTAQTRLSMRMPTQL